MKFQAGQNIIDKIRGKNAHKNQIKKFSDSLLEIINRDEPHQVSNGEDVYAYEYSWKVKFLAKLFHTFCDKFNISLIHQNKFGYSLYYPAKNVSEATIERILSFDFPVDSLPEFTLFNKYPRQYNTIFDVGANKGHSSCFFSKIAQKVFAFEPVPYLVDELKQNVTLNNCKNIEIIEKAVSNQSGKTRFNLYDSDGHNSLLRHDQSKFKKSIDVDMITLDEFCKNKGISHIDLLSIDVEGYEYNVLQGGGGIVSHQSCRPYFI